MVIDLFFGLAGALCLLIVVYLFILAAASVLPEKGIRPSAPRIRFCIIIPAHNEAKTIGATLKAIDAVDYPAHLYETVVIADNCQDDTCNLAQGLGVQCLERNEPGPRGKGRVLQWAFPRLLQSGTHDAFVVIDADTHMDSKFLQVMNNCLCSGEKVIQGYSQVRNPGRSTMESLSFLGFALNRNLRYRGRSRLGWSANLMGTGMCFSRKIIEDFGWPACSMVEDVEFTMFLRLRGIRVFFADKARITVELHSSIKNTRGQRLRWDLGKMEIRNRYVPLLIRRALNTGDIACIDSALELILPPFPTLFLLITGGFGLYLLINGLRECQGVCLTWAWDAAGIVLYTLVGIASARARPEVYRALIYAPFLLVWRSWILLRESLRKNRKLKW